MADSNPVLPPPIMRQLPTSLAANGVNSPEVPASVSPVSQLQRPPVAQTLNPLPQKSMPANGVGGWVKLCDANPNRVSLVMRIRNGDASTLLYLGGVAGSNSPTSTLFPLENGDDFTLEVTGEVWAMTASSSSACLVRMLETLSVPQRT